jgi:hypothetical protein
MASPFSFRGFFFKNRPSESRDNPFSDVISILRFKDFKLIIIQVTLNDIEMIEMGDHGLDVFSGHLKLFFNMLRRLTPFAVSEKIHEQIFLNIKIGGVPDFLELLITPTGITLDFSSHDHSFTRYSHRSLMGAAMGRRSASMRPD